ncbi:MAG: hypothetical protein RJA99_857 [Pseudomonadota bacterium]
MTPTFQPFDRRRLLKGTLAAALLTTGRHAAAQGYPSRTVTMIVPSNAGASSDRMARFVAQRLTQQTGAASVVENKPGANGIIGVQGVLNAPADGHTVLVTTISPVIFNRYLYKTLPYDPQKDLQAVAIYAQSAMLLGATPKLPARDLPALVDFARANPGRLNFGFATSTQQLSGEMMQLKSGAKMTFVPYRTNAAMLTALVSGEIDLAISDPAGFLPMIQANQIRVLATTAPRRLPNYRAVPTFAEHKVDFVLETWNGIFMKRGTSPEVLALLSKTLRETLQTPEVRTYLEANSYDDYVVTGDDATKRVDLDLATWKALTAEAGVVPQ